jgi:LysR family glycine cleavage system transcriptional activator
LDALRVFDAAARKLSFAKAAEDLHLTASAVSHRIKALEAILGVRLFARHTRRVHLTREGRAYAETVASALALLRDGTRTLAGKEARPLTVSVAPLFALRWLLPRFPRFEAGHPEVGVRLISTCKIADLSGDDVDCAIRFGQGNWQGLVAARLVSLDLVPICTPALARAEPLLRAPGDLAKHSLLHCQCLPAAWRMWLLAAGVRGVDTGRGQTFDDIPGVIQAALAGDGVALADPKFIADELAAGRLLVPFGGDIPAGGAFYFVFPERRIGDRRIEIFRDWLLAELAAGSSPSARRARRAPNARASIAKDAAKRTKHRTAAL